MRKLRNAIVAFLLAVAMLFTASPVFGAGSVTGDSSNPKLVDSSIATTQTSTIKTQKTVVKKFNKVSNGKTLYTALKSTKIYWANGKSKGKKISAKTKKKMVKASKMWRYYPTNGENSKGTILTLKTEKAIPAGKKVYYLHYDHVAKKWYLTRTYPASDQRTCTNKSGIRLGDVAVVYLK
ncbi:MAG: hypothetical protein J6P61_09785 [Erysipelotrichaceae bacterium]|nr:hypothetical protein [Erysipelotrichaceae bacterium]